MVCKNCSKDIPLETKFCHYCGESLKDVVKGEFIKITYASFSKRTFSYLIDAIILIIVSFPFIIIFDSVFFLSILLFIAYYTFTEASNLQASPGKKILGLKVTDMDGNQLTIGRSFIRQISKLLSSIFYVGYILALFTEKKQALHDLISNCLVMEVKETIQKDTRVESKSQNMFEEAIRSNSGSESYDDTLSPGEITRKVKKGLSSLPGFTVISDAVMGMSGLNKQLEYLKDDPKDPLNWIQYYECYVTYQKMRHGVSWVRIITNPAGFALSKGISSGLNALDDEHKEFDATNCLKQAVILSEKKLKAKNYNAQDIAILAKAYFYLSINEEEYSKVDELLKKAIQFMSKAIEGEKSTRLKAEYFFFLSQFYQQAANQNLRYKSLNISRKLGFQPALQVLKKELIDKGMEVDELKYIELPVGVTPISTFHLTYKPSFEKKIENTIEGVFKGQSNKIKETSNMLKRIIQ